MTRLVIVAPDGRVACFTTMDDAQLAAWLDERAHAAGVPGSRE